MGSAKLQVRGKRIRPPVDRLRIENLTRHQVDDAEKRWLFKDDYFDLVHMRGLAQSLTDWPSVMKDAHRVTKPGGWIELVEVGAAVESDDNTMADDNPVRIFMDLITEAMVKIGEGHLGGS